MDEFHILFCFNNRIDASSKLSSIDSPMDSPIESSIVCDTVVSVQRNLNNLEHHLAIYIYFNFPPSTEMTGIEVKGTEVTSI